MQSESMDNYKDTNWSYLAVEALGWISRSYPQILIEYLID